MGAADFARVLRLPVALLGLSLLSILGGVIRAVMLDGVRHWTLLHHAIPLLCPVAVWVALCWFWSRRASVTARGEALGAALSVTLVAAVVNVVVLHPQYNQDANIGLGLYVLLGALYPLGPAGVGGGLVGHLLARRRLGMVVD